MPSATMVSRLIEAAELLLESRPRSSAFRRKAVSASYYAVFHELAKICSQTLLPNLAGATEEYLRVYRSLDHGPMKNAFSQVPLRDHERLQGIGKIFVRLQSERNRADYMPPDAELFPLEDARKLVAQARGAVTDLNALSDPDRVLLATCLLFKNRLG